jgi:hypothetical protein
MVALAAVVHIQARRNMALVLEQQIKVMQVVMVLVVQQLLAVAAVLEQ